MPWVEPIVKHMPCFASTLAEWCWGWFALVLWGWDGIIFDGGMAAWPPVSAASLQAFNPNVCHAVSRFTHHSTRKSQPMASQFHRNPIVCRMACPLESGTLSYQDRFLPETSPGTNPAASTLDGSSFFPAPERALLTNPSLSKTTLDNFKFRWGLPSKQLRLGRNIQQFLRMRYLPTTAISIGKMITSGITWDIGCPMMGPIRFKMKDPLAGWFSPFSKKKKQKLPVPRFNMLASIHNGSIGSSPGLPMNFSSRSRCLQAIWRSYGGTYHI